MHEIQIEVNKMEKETCDTQVVRSMFEVSCVSHLMGSVANVVTRLTIYTTHTQENNNYIYNTTADSSMITSRRRAAFFSCCRSFAPENFPILKDDFTCYFLLSATVSALG